MSTIEATLHIRNARNDETGAILSWLDDPALLAATNSKRSSEVEQSRLRQNILSKIASKSLWIIVRDNFRIGAILSTPQEENTVFVFMKGRLDRALLAESAVEMWRDQLAKSAGPKLIARNNLAQMSPDASPANHVNRTHSESKLITADLKSVKKIQILGPKLRNESIRKKLAEQGFHVEVSPEPYENRLSDEFSPDIILSSGYDRLLRPDTVEKFRDRIINLHAAYLPWARGIGTTLFATLLRYPHGVSIHYINEGLDTGDLIARRILHPAANDSLRTIYTKLLDTTEDLFFENFSQICDNKSQRSSQESFGEIKTTRSRTQFEALMDLCPKGYDTSISDLEKYRDSLEASFAFRNFLFSE